MLASAARAQPEAPAPVSEARVQELKNLRFGMFVCWSMSTFSGYEWTPGVKDISFFNPTGCDTDQWARAAKEAGMGYILFLTKHHDGFCLWDTGTTARKVGNTPALKGRDVLAELRKSCDAHGIKLALYFSESEFGDNALYHPGGFTPEMKKQQLAELLTRYGPIEFLWFDHAVGDGGVSHQDTFNLCKKLQPDCLVGFNSGAPAGDIFLRERGQAAPLGDAAGLSTSHMKQRAEKPGICRLAEFTYPILEGQKLSKLRGSQWFYSLPENDAVCSTPEKIYKDYLGAVKYGNIFSLDVGPDRSGRLRDIDVKTLATVGKWISGKAAPPASDGAGSEKGP